MMGETNAPSQSTKVPLGVGAPPPKVELPESAWKIIQPLAAVALVIASPLLL